MSISRRDFVIKGVGSACAVAAAGTGLAETDAGHSTPNALPDRMPEITPGNMTPEQKKAAETFAGGAAGGVFGPFVPLLRSPEVMLRAKAIGEYLHATRTIPSKLKEFAILITAREWTQQYTWDLHYPVALTEGVDVQVAQALAQGSRPEGMTPEEQIVYEFCAELHRNQSVSDAAYQRVKDRYGEQGVIDLITICGFYTFMSMVLNTARTALPKNAGQPLPAFPH
jgi:4-carboxymuconolactone decarboxylase